MVCGYSYVFVYLLGYPLNEDDVSEAVGAHALSSKAKLAQGLAPQSRPVTSEGLVDTDRNNTQSQSDSLPIPYTTAPPSFAHSHSKGSLPHMKASFSATSLRNSSSVVRLGLGQIREETAETHIRFDTRDASPVVLEQSLPSNSHHISSSQYPSLHFSSSSHSTAPTAHVASSSSQSHSTRVSHWKKEDVFITRVIRLELVSTHGDDTYIGLTGIELLGLAPSSHSNSDLKLVPIQLYERNIETEPSDLSALGFYDDPRLPKNLVSGVNNTKNGNCCTILYL